MGEARCEMTRFERYAPAIAALHASFVAMACHFGVVTLIGGSPVTPELYGAAVYEIPALTWVSVQIIVHGTACLGAMLRGRVGAWMLLAGSFCAGFLHATFVVMAQEAPHGTLLSAGALWLGVMLSTASFGVALCSIVRGRVYVE
jgi:hypothetical protein